MPRNSILINARSRFGQELTECVLAQLVVSVEPPAFDLMQLNQLPQTVDSGDPSNQHKCDTSWPL